MIIMHPRLWCAGPDLEPGTVRIAWEANGIPDSLMLAGNSADNALEQFRGAPDERARGLLLVSLIQNREAAHV